MTHAENPVDWTSKYSGRGSRDVENCDSLPRHGHVESLTAGYGREIDETNLSITFPATDMSEGTARGKMVAMIGTTTI